MAYNYQDSGAIGNDHAWHAYVLTQLRANLAQARTERAVATGWMPLPTVSGSGLADRQRWGAVHPTPYGPWWVYCPDYTTSLTVRVYVAAVQWAQDAPGSADLAVQMTATVGSRSGWIDEPGAPEDWPEQLTTSLTDQEVAITVTPSLGVQGWVPVFVWVRSLYKATALDSGTSSTLWSEEGIQLTGVTSPPASTYYPEVALVVGTDPTGKGSLIDDVGTYTGIYYDTGDTFLSTVPPLRITDPTGGTEWAIHKLGIVEVSGVSIETTPDRPGLPDAVALGNSQPASEEPHQGLVRAVGTLRDTRRRQPACHPGQDGYRQQWLLYGDYGGASTYPAVVGTAGTTADYVTLGQWLIPGPSPSATDIGWEAILSLYWWSPSGYEVGEHEDGLILRARTIDPIAATAMDTGSESSQDINVRWQRSPGSQVWDQLQHLAVATYRLDPRIHLRGAMVGRPLDGGQYGDDWRLPRHHTITVEQSGATSYPCALQVQARLGWDGQVIRGLCVGAGVRQLEGF